MKNKKSVYYEAAIACLKSKKYFFVCDYFGSIKQGRRANSFKKYFKPTEEERKEYEFGWAGWLSTLAHKRDKQVDHEFKAMCLLLMHEIVINPIYK